VIAENGVEFHKNLRFHVEVGDISQKNGLFNHYSRVFFEFQGEK
jgi:hypothetical protein